jgi:DNA-binding transcriptional ArsR family regulator
VSVRVRPLKYLLGWLIAGTRGGVTRAKIIETLRENPQNANQLANSLEMDYRTIRHHLKILQKNRIITSAGDRYGTTYFLSVEMEENYGVFEEILNKLWKKQKREKKK